MQHLKVQISMFALQNYLCILFHYLIKYHIQQRFKCTVSIHHDKIHVVDLQLWTMLCLWYTSLNLGNCTPWCNLQLYCTTWWNHQNSHEIQPWPLNLAVKCFVIFWASIVFAVPHQTSRKFIIHLWFDLKFNHFLNDTLFIKS